MTDGMDPEAVSAFRDAIDRLINRGYGHDPSDVDIYCGKAAWLRFNGDYYDVVDQSSVEIDGYQLLKTTSADFPNDRILIVDDAAVREVPEPVSWRMETEESVIPDNAITGSMEYTQGRRFLLTNPAAIEFVYELESGDV